MTSSSRGCFYLRYIWYGEFVCRSWKVWNQINRLIDQQYSVVSIFSFRLIILSVVLLVFEYDRSIKCIELLWIYIVAYICLLFGKLRDRDFFIARWETMIFWKFQGWWWKISKLQKRRKVAINFNFISKLRFTSIYTELSAHYATKNTEKLFN